MSRRKTPNMSLSLRTLKRVPRILSLVSDLEDKVSFLVQENIRLNQLLRELIWQNDLKRPFTGAQARGSFDYQWREVPDGPFMAGNPDFLKLTPELVLERTALPREWFPGKRVLDAGCGSGRWSWGLAELGARVTSVDQSPAAVEATRRLLADRPGAEVKQQDLLGLDLPERAYDLVWCFGVAHHTENLLKAMATVASRVKEDGWLFMMLYGYPETAGAFAVKASYEQWRQRLLHLPFEEKAAVLSKTFPRDEVHGYFDAVSPLINELVTWEWIQAFLQEQGFGEFKRTLDHANHHFVARRRGVATTGA